MTRRGLGFFVCLISSLFVACSSVPSVYPTKADRNLLVYKAEMDQAESYLETGRYCQKIYDYGNAERYFLKSFEACRRIGFEEGMLYSLNDVALLNIERGYFSTAKSNLLQALALARKTAIQQAESDVLNNMALLDIVSGQGNFDVDTRTLLLSAWGLCRMPIKGLVIRLNMALFALSQGDFSKAESELRRVKKQSSKKGYYELEIRSTLRLGQLFLQKGEQEKGLRYANEAYDLAVYWEDKRGIVDASELLSFHYERTGERNQALAYAKIIHNVRKGLAAKAFEESDLARIRRLESP